MLSGVSDGARGRRWRRSRTAPPAAAAPATPAVPVGREVDDLPGFFTAPPGSPRALPAAPVEPAPAPATAAGTTDGAATPGTTDAPGTTDEPPTTDGPRATDADGGTAGGAGRRPGARRGLVAGGAVVAVVAAATAAALLTGRGTGDDGPPPAATTTGATTPGSPSAPPAPSASAAPLTAAAPGDLAATDLPPGTDGFAAAVSFGGVVLEPRAVGVTVAYPALRVSSDGDRTLAHVELAVWNCLADTPPADPAVADCRRGLTEYADLPTPDLQAVRSGGGVQLSGSFPTYTRPNGSPPVATGRSYALEVRLQDRRGSVSGTLQLGDGQAAAAPGGTFTTG